MRIEKRSVKQFNGKVSRERDARLWWRCVAAIVGGVIMVCGFSVAAQQSLSAREQSVENIKLQRERERLKAEQKRLLLNRETLASPEQLRKRAEKIGLRGMSAAQINSFETEIAVNQTQLNQMAAPKTSNAKTTAKSQ